MFRQKKWESYEQVATYLLNQFARKFELERVEGKQNIIGRRSGTEWEIDGKGFRQDGDGFVIIECRRYTTSKQNQERIAALAYRIHDTGAKGGIIVTPLGLQEGARRVSTAEKIISVRLNPNCTQTTYMMQFLNQIMVGIQAHAATLKASLKIALIDKDGNIVPP